MGLVIFSQEKNISQLLEFGIKDIESYFILKESVAILSKISDFINKYLDLSKDTYPKGLSIDGILLELQLKKKEYFQALSIAIENEFKLHLKRDTNSWFINTYNPVLLKAWKANIDLQPVYSYYKAVSFITAYFSKSENTTLEAIKQADQEIKLQNLSGRVAMK